MKECAFQVDQISCKCQSDEIESSGKMDEEIITYEPNKSGETSNGHFDKTTSKKINDEVIADESFITVNGVNKKLPSYEIGNKTYTSECFEQTKHIETIKDLANNQQSIKMDDEALSNESDGEISEMDVNEQLDLKLDYMKDSILECVAKSDGFFKSQQVGESDLTFSEKWEIASNLLMKSVPLFLQRYWKFIKFDDVPYFDSYKSDYEVNFYVNEITKLQNAHTNKVRIKNRRYEALQRMVEEGSYFSDSEMKKRNPFLYDQMIGQHLTEKERIDAYKDAYPDKNFSAFLLNQMEKNIENCLFEKQKNEDEAIVEEEDDDSEEEEEESELEDEEPVKKVVSGEEKKQLRSEFTNIMYESFLDGNDKDFDYGSVDDNVDFDSIHQRDIDEQEKYFDEESSHSSN